MQRHVVDRCHEGRIVTAILKSVLPCLSLCGALHLCAIGAVLRRSGQIDGKSKVFPVRR